MTISVGDRLPNTILIKATADGPDQVDSDAFFKGRKVALFAVPGAFTPTCSAKHLPGFVEKSADAGDITMLADGNGDFAKAVGLTMDGSKFGMGQRSQRYSMIVDDGVVTQLNVEAPGEFNVSSADYLIDKI